MPEATSSLSFVARILSKLPGLALRWYYHAARLANGVHVDVEPRDDPLRVNFDRGNTFIEVRMRVVNLLPLQIELDRSGIQVDCDGAFRVDLFNVERQVISSGAFSTVRFRGSVTDGQVDRLIAHNPVNRSGVSGRFEFSCKVRRFSKDLGDLRGVHLRRLNEPRQ